MSPWNDWASPRSSDGLGDDLLRDREQLPPGGGQGHPGAAALEQRHAERLLERPDLRRQRRLADVQLLGGPGQVAQLRHGGESAQLIELHRVPKAACPRGL